MIGDLQQTDLSDIQKKNITLLKKLIAENIIEIKLFEKSKLHAKLYLFLTNPPSEYQSPGLAVVGSSNFTKKGLTQNKELNVVLTSREEVVYLNKWFDELWEEAIDFSEDLIKIIDYSGVTAEKTKYPKLGEHIEPELLFKYLVHHWFDGRVKNLLKKDVPMEISVNRCHECYKLNQHLQWRDPCRLSGPWEKLHSRRHNRRIHQRETSHLETRKQRTISTSYTTPITNKSVGGPPPQPGLLLPGPEQKTYQPAMT